MLNVRISGIIVAFLLVLTAVAASNVVTEPFDPVPDPDLALGTYTHPAGGKTLTLAVGIGSSAARSPFDLLTLFASLFRHDRLVDAVWTVSDRGPNFQCEEASLVIGLTDVVACPAEGTVPAGVGRIYARPDYSPSIYRVVLKGDGTFRVVRTIPLRTADGTPITGLPNPLTVALSEIPRDGEGKVIAQDASSIDAEGLVRVPHFGGRFLIGEENATGLLEVRGNGRIIKRFVPAGTEHDYTNPPAPLAPAGYDIDGSLPAILAKRRLNRGIESLAISADYRFIYFVVQSPLDNPNNAGTVRDSANIRLYKLRIDWHPQGSKLTAVGEWVYPLEPVSTFQSLGATDAVRRRDLRISEMLRLGGERFLILERTDQVTILFEVDLASGTNILDPSFPGPDFDSLATAPSLELTADLASVGVTPLKKTQRFVASSLAGAQPRFPAKLEGLTRVFDGRILIINDDDFGITDATTQINLVGGIGD